MVEYLKFKKRFYKYKKNGIKKKISQKKYKKNKTKKNRIGGGKIKEITEDETETEFVQRNAIINYGYGPVSTYNLVNCISIGGVFELDGKTGTFLTHESPTDFLEQQSKLTRIKEILDEKKAIITKIVIFRIDKPSITVYANGLDTSKIIDIMSIFSQKLFYLEPIMTNYSCDLLTMRCGKAIISPTGHNSILTELRVDSHVEPSLTELSFAEEPSFAEPSLAKEPSLAEEHLKTFIVEVLYNTDGKKIYQCPICKFVTGTLAVENPTNTSFFSHKFNCPNKNKIPIEA